MYNVRARKEQAVGTIRIGLIGAGFIGVNHANAIEAIIADGFADAEFTAICDQDAARAEAIAGAFGASAHCDDPVGLIRSGDIDTVFICTPTNSHPLLVEAAASEGLNILCEKPLARSLSEAREMHTVVSNAGVKNQVGLVLRYSPVFHTIKRLISNPELGRPMSVTLRDDQYFPIQGIYSSSWRGDVEVAGGGALIEHSIHDVDIMRWLFGEIASVRGRVRNFAGHEGIEDLVTAQLEFESGCIGQLTSIWHNVLGRESNRHIEIFFENGYVSSEDDFIGSVNYQGGKGGLETISSEEVLGEYLESVGMRDPKFNSLHSMQALQNYHFLKALAEGGAPRPTFDAALKAHEIVEAIYQAARTNSEVTLPLE
jgi:predicted dehydrogenase